LGIIGDENIIPYFLIKFNKIIYYNNKGDDILANEKQDFNGQLLGTKSNGETKKLLVDNDGKIILSDSIGSIASEYESLTIDNTVGGIALTG